MLDKSYIKSVKKSKTEDELDAIIDRLYVKGFESGYDDGR